MNRRQFATVSAASIAFSAQAFAQTPPATPEMDTPDLRAREIVGLLEGLNPLTLLEALETANVSDPDLVSGGVGLAPIPWQDFGDTDLYNSLGGVIIGEDGITLGSPDLQMVGGYIVYESAEVAYHELSRKLGDLYDNPSMTTNAGGTNHWIIESDELQISVGRVGYVLILGLISLHPEATTGLIGHLHNVAESLAG